MVASASNFGTQTTKRVSSLASTIRISTEAGPSNMHIGASMSTVQANMDTGKFTLNQRQQRCLKTLDSHAMTPFRTSRTTLDMFETSAPSECFLNTSQPAQS